MIFKILVFIGLYFLIKNMLKSAFVSAHAGTTQQNTTTKTTANSQKSDIIDAEFKVIKEE
jgi:hypothetical protein